MKTFLLNASIVCIALFSSSKTHAQNYELGIKADYGGTFNTYGFNKSGSSAFKINKNTMVLGGYLERRIFGPLALNIGIDYVEISNCSISHPFTGTITPDTEYYTYKALKIPANLSLQLNGFMYGSAGVSYHHDLSTFTTPKPFPNKTFTGLGYHFEAGLQLHIFNLLRLRAGLFLELNNGIKSFQNDPSAKVIIYGLRARTGLKF